MATRKEMWDRLGDPVDVLVIGGGVTGCGIARDAALRGLKVAQVEMRDFAFGTSSRSSKLVHGGLRYLEQYEFSLVFEAVSERRVLLEVAPHLVRPLGFLFPIYPDSRQPLWLLKAGMVLYDGLSLFKSPKRHRALSPGQAVELEPALRREGLKGAPLYYDCATDDARITLENAVDAARLGAVTVSHAKAVSLIKDPMGIVCGAEIQCRLTGEKKTVNAGVVINATGPWTDKVVAMSDAFDASLLRPTKGIHLVVDQSRLPLEHAVVCFHPDDGRVLFAIPWGTQTYVGTTDTDDPEDPSNVHATLSDVDYLLEVMNQYFPGRDFVHDDVLATWAGLRPLMRPASKDGKIDESSVSREHQVLRGKDGLITIAGGKLTTYRRMASEVVDVALHALRDDGSAPERVSPAHTDKLPLPGAVGWPADGDANRLVQQVAEVGCNLPRDVARHLVGSYGTRAVDVARLVRSDASLEARLVPGRPEILAQVDWAVSEEMAADVDDIIIRRTQLYYRTKDQGLSAVPAVAARMQQLLGWSDDQAQAAIARCEEEIRKGSAWRPENGGAAAPEAG